MRVLVACEFSGVVRDAFRSRGHDAYSCDLVAGNSKYHIVSNVLNIINDGWDLMIAHPPCDHLAVSGARHFKHKTELQESALEFVRCLMDAPIEKICIENPVSIISTRIRKPTQIINPYQFGHNEVKRTCLWLKNLPKLIPTDICENRYNFIANMPGSKGRARNRSITYKGIAKAMADQWG